MSEANKTQSPLSALESILVYGVFILFNTFWGLKWAIGAATIWSLGTIYRRYKSGIPIGRFLPLVSLYVIARGVLGIVFDSENIYFGIGIGTRVLIGLGIIGAALINQNIIETAAPYVFDFSTATKNHPIYKRTLKIIAFWAGAYYIMVACFDVWLLANSSTNGYVIIKTAISWPLGVAVFWISVFYAGTKLKKIPDFPGFYTLLERQSQNYVDFLNRKLTKEGREEEKARKQKEGSSRDGAGESVAEGFMEGKVDGLTDREEDIDI